MDTEVIETAEYHAGEATRKARDAIGFTKAHGFDTDIIRRLEWGEGYIAEALRMIELKKLEPKNA